MMEDVYPSDDGSLRLRVTMGFMILALLFLGGWLWHIQVGKAAEYQDDIYRQSIRRVRLPGARGRILDRHGVPMADNRPSYCIAVYVNEFRKPGGWGRTVDAVQQSIQRLSGVIGLPPAITRDDIYAHIRRRLPLPLIAWRDVSAEVMARLASHAMDYPGFDIYAEPVRTYPQGAHGAHLLGYARGQRSTGDTSTLEDEQGRFHYYVPELNGVQGVEKTCNDMLAGQAGGRLLRVDASGYVRELGDNSYRGLDRNPQPGRDVYLTIDMTVQRVAEKCLQGLQGAVVVIDPRNGDVLALASAPAYDPNAFVPGISSAEWNLLSNDPANPLLNRAVAGTYPPGSTFKPVVAIAALQNHKVSSTEEFNCPGYYSFGNARLKCWIYKYNRGHGMLAMRKAFEQSCNTYFCELGVRTGYEAIYHTALAMGLGARTGIELDGEHGGRVPVLRSVHSRGDLCNLSIGQGALLTTPLQMAMVTATIANGGKLYQPRLVLGTASMGSASVENLPPRLIHDLEWDPHTERIVKQGMLDVVHSPTGTGKRARVPGILIGGKTGTAQYGPAEALKTRGWMIAFAPYDQPRYAVAMVVDEAVAGGLIVGPQVRALFLALFYPDGNVPPEEVDG